MGKRSKRPPKNPHANPQRAPSVVPNSTAANATINDVRLPWMTLLEHDGRWLMLGFNGASWGGPLVGYGSHGDVVVART